MNIALGIGAFLMGIFAGSLIVKAVAYWVTLLLAALGREVGDDSISTQEPRIPKASLLFAVIHPVPWALLIGLPYSIYYLFHNPPSSTWMSFLGGITSMIVAILVAVVVLKQQGPSEESATATGSNESND